MIFFYLLVSVLPLVRHPLWSGLVGDFTVVKYVGASALAYAVVYLVFRPRFPRFFATPQARFFVALALWGMISYVTRGVPRPFEITPLMSYLSFVVFFFITISVVDSVRRLEHTVLVAIGSVGFASLHVLREWQKYGAFAQGYRPGWVTGDPNYYSVSALLCLPLAFHLMVQPRARWERWFCAACLGVTLLGLTAAASRGGMLGLGTVVILLAWGAKQRVRILAIAGVLLVPVMLLSPSAPLQRLLSPSRSDSSSSDTRMKLWAAGLQMLAAHPLTGVGAGNFKEFAPVYGVSDGAGSELEHIAHNTYIEMAAEMGLPGLLLFIGVLGSTLRATVVAERWGQEADNTLVIGIGRGTRVGVVAFAVAAIFLSAQYQKLLWLVVFLSIVLVELGRRSALAARGDVEGGVGLTESGRPPKPRRASRSPAYPSLR